MRGPGPDATMPPMGPVVSDIVRLARRNCSSVPRHSRLRKLQVNNRAEASAKLVRLGLAGSGDPVGAGS